MKFWNFEDVFEADEVYFFNNRISKDKKEVILKISEDKVFETKYGFGIYLANNKVIFINNWQLSINFTGETEVYLKKEYFKTVCATKQVESDIPDTWDKIIELAKTQKEKATWLKRGVYLR